MNGKIYTDSEVGEVKLVRSVRARRISIRVHPVKGVTVTVPCFAGYDSGLKFYLSRRDWVIKAVQRQKRNICDCIHLAPEQVERLRAQAKEYLPSRLAFLAAKYGFVYNRVTIKHNRSNWGSCSTRGNINLNLNLMRLPVLLADYVLLHELCHLRHPDHGGDFHGLLEKLCADNLAVTAAAFRDNPSMAVQAPQAYRFLGELQKAVSSSSSSRPVSYSLERAIRRYRLG